PRNLSGLLEYLEGFCLRCLRKSRLSLAFAAPPLAVLEYLSSPAGWADSGLHDAASYFLQLLVSKLRCFPNRTVCLILRLHANYLLSQWTRLIPPSDQCCKSIFRTFPDFLLPVGYSG